MSTYRVFETYTKGYETFIEADSQEEAEEQYEEEIDGAEAFTWKEVICDLEVSGVEEVVEHSPSPSTPDDRLETHNRKLLDRIERNYVQLVGEGE